jgi:predicted O-methyltransferase YrrM
MPARRTGPIGPKRWAAVDRYLEAVLLGPDPVLEAALAASAAAGLPAIQVSPLQGRLLTILAQAQGARAILEVGTLGGYSTICLARALPADGRLVTLEVEAAHAAVARANVAHAGLADRVEVRVGPAAESLRALDAEHRGPFDFVFIDADKVGYPEYFSWALRLARRGTLIVADNVVRDGEIIDPASADASVRAVRRLNDLMAGERRVRATVLQTVGTKGYDGFAIAVVIGDP